MSIKPILFNTDMVRAILDGRKTVTRRLIKPQPKEGHYTYVYCHGNCHIKTETGIIKPLYQPGNILYVRETWSDHYVPDEEGKAKLEYCYKADGTDIKGECLPGENNRWYPSIHMPKEAARIWLKVKDVRVERLQEITPQEAWKEGAICSCMSPIQDCAGNKTAFIDIWNSTIKKSDLDRYGWDASPWVWVIEFERCEKPKVT